MTDRPLWPVEAMAAAMGATPAGPLPSSVPGISIDTRTVAPGEAFFAIKGDNRDGHDFVEAALKAGAGLAVVAVGRRDSFRNDAPLLVVPDVLEGLRGLACAARARTQAKIVAVTGSVGKTSTKEALRLTLARNGETHASVASYNNHWGVPLSLARCPQTVDYAVFEIGMNHAGEIEPLTRLVRPQVAIITTVEPVHLEFFQSVEAIADAKAEIFHGLERGGAAVLNRDNPQFTRLERGAMDAGADRIVSFGEHPRADARLMKCALQSDSTTVHARIFGTDVTYKVGAPGRHLVFNSLAVLAADVLLGADLALAALALADLQPASGRGSRVILDLPRGTVLVIDESYNANPASMRAALALLGHAEIGSRGRRIAVLGDMLELGPRGADLHRELAMAVLAHGIDLVFCCGPLMRALWEALPASRQGGYAETSTALESHVLAAIQPGDAIMVKGSLGSRMAPIVKALQSRYRRAALAQVSTTNG
jgi:UDP-N-acetylmuramoyl-tripeptide--D-alanyl-D-alanine ligase